MTVPNEQQPAAADLWSEWVLGRRYGANADYRRRADEVINRIVDRVLQGAHLAPRMVLADVGTGDGRLGLKAIASVGPSLRVFMTDISAPLLQHARKSAADCGVAEQCVFVEGSAERLDGIGAGTVDVVATRAVLAYVADKLAALREFHRVLKPGGWISIAEPIMQNDAFEAMALRRSVEAQPDNPDLEFLRLLQRLKAAQFPSTEEEIRQSPIANFSERDLARFVRDAGFPRMHLELHIDLVPSLINTWDIFLETSPHPLAPSPGKILAERFSAAERQLFERVVRPMIESPDATSTDMIAYLTAEKPAA